MCAHTVLALNSTALGFETLTLVPLSFELASTLSFVLAEASSGKVASMQSVSM